MAFPLKALRRLKEAEASTLRAVAIYEPIVKRNHTHFESRRFELKLMRDLAQAREGGVRIDTWRAALKMAERLRRDFPQNRKAIEQESYMAMSLATSLEGADRMELFARARKLAKSVGSSGILFKIHVKTGQSLFEQQEFTQAEESLRSAINLWKALGSDPDNSQRLLHGMAYLDLGRTLAAVDRKQEAITAFKQSIEILEKLVAVTPDNRIVQANLKASRNMLAELSPLENSKTTESEKQ